MKKGRLKEIVAELQAASKMHLKQSKEIEAHIDDMGSPAKMGKGDSYKDGELLDENIAEEMTGNDPLVQDLSTVQTDSKGQYVTELDTNEDVFANKRPTNQILESGKPRDTFRAPNKTFKHRY